jgi:hypothetical protein
VRVRYVEGQAIHSGPESCVVIREGDREALTGEHIGQLLSRESTLSRALTGLGSWKATRTGALCERPAGPAWSTGTWHVCTLLAREPGDLGFGRQAPPVRVGEARSRSR